MKAPIGPCDACGGEDLERVTADGHINLCVACDARERRVERDDLLASVDPDVAGMLIALDDGCDRAYKAAMWQERAYMSGQHLGQRAKADELWDEFTAIERRLEALGGVVLL